MQIVIEISKEEYEYLKAHHSHEVFYGDAIAKGTPLPEHHGVLIDRTELFDRLKNNCSGRCEFCTNWSAEGCKNILNCTEMISST